MSDAVFYPGGHGPLWDLAEDPQSVLLIETAVVAFLVEDMLKENGGTYSQGPDWAPYVVTDGILITGQNPASSAPAALALLKELR